MIALITRLQQRFSTLTPDTYSHTAPKKNTIGKASKGFDILGKRILPTGILPSASALSRMQRSTARPLSVQKLKQRATKKRTGLVWLCLPFFWALTYTPAFAADCTRMAAGFGSAGTSNCVCVIAGGVQSLIGRFTDGTVGISSDVSPILTNDEVGTQIFTNLSSTSSPKQRYSCDWNGSLFSNGRFVTDLLEPSDQPSDASVTGSSSTSLTLSWTDSGGSPLPEKYIVQCDTDSGFANSTTPSDGNEQSNDSDCKSGSSGVQNITHGTEEATWSGLDNTTQYYFRIYAYASSGANIDYLLFSPATTNGTTTAITTTTATTDSEPSGPINPGVFGGEKITPTTYSVTIAKIEFKNAQGEYVTVAEGGTQFDVASVDANASLGSFGKTNDLPAGTYTEMRITLSNNFEISASGSDKGTACSTSSSGSSGSISSTLTNGSTGSNTGGAATTQPVSYPTGSAASSALSDAGVSESGNDLQISSPVNFTVKSGGSVPSIAINVDVTDSVEVLTSGDNCFILPQPPSVNVVVGS